MRSLTSYALAVRASATSLSELEASWARCLWIAHLAARRQWSMLLLLQVTVWKGPSETVMDRSELSVQFTCNDEDGFYIFQFPWGERLQVQEADVERSRPLCLSLIHI